jgi:paraquat-inducible protein B
VAAADEPAPPPPPVTPAQPQPPLVRSRRLPLSIVWLVPLVAALIGLSLLAKTWATLGPRITISLQSAAGLEAGKTTVKYKNVVIGRVTAITLSNDRQRVEVSVTLDQRAEAFAGKDTRYWVVRPRIGTTGVSGIDTILSGAYIAADVGASAERSDEFVGLEVPPTVISGVAGKTFVLRGTDLGSLDVGSPVYYRRVQVGQLASYKLDDDGQGLELQVFVEAPHDRHVRAGSRFWNASGVDVSVGADGFKLDAQSIATIIAGGIAFATPFGADAAPAADQARFLLEDDEKTALAPPDGVPQYVQLRFDQAVRGLAVGAPVELQGVNIGRVVSMRLDYEPTQRRFPTVVGALVYPQRLARLRDKLGIVGSSERERAADFLRVLVANGMRARVRTGNLLTGQLYVSLDIVPKATAVAFDARAEPLVLPTVDGGFEKLQEQVGSIVAKVDRIPFESIGQRLDSSLLELDATLKRLRTEVLPGASGMLGDARSTLGDARGAINDARGAIGDARGAIGAARQTFTDSDAALQQNLNLTLTELQRAARSLRNLTDLLGRQPQSVLRGLPADAPPKEVPR